MKRLLRNVVVAVVLSGLAFNSAAQQTSKAPNLNLGPLVPVSPPGSALPLQLNRATGEADGRVLMVCGGRPSSHHNTQEGFVYASYDSGRTWQETLVESSSAWVSEESCALGTDGRAYFVAGVSNA